MERFIFLGVVTLAICCNMPVLAQTSQTLVAANAVWRYWGSTAAPASANWKGGGTFDDSAWPSGAAPLGYSPDNIDNATTPIASGCASTTYNCPGKYPTICFRHTFNLTNVNDYKSFFIRYQRDDGIVIYVNGAEVRRESMPVGIITHATSPTSSVSDEAAWQTTGPSNSFVPDRMFLHTGLNTITAEVHQAGSDSPLNNSTDLRFALTLEGIPANVAPQLKIVRGPYLQMGTSTAISFRWSTAALSRGQVRYDTIATNLTVGNAQAKVATEAALTSDHQIRLTGLLPNKKYYYVIESAGPPVVQLEGEASAASSWFFQTAPLPGTARKTRIWALGDFGTNPASQTANSRQDSVIVSFKNFKQQQGIGYVDLWLWMGDNAYDWGLDEQFQDNVFDKTAGRYDWLFRQTPFYASPGNHDYQNNWLAGGLRYEPHPIHYYDIVNNFAEVADGGGGVPSHQEEYYSFNYNNIHIVSLDSYGFETGQGTAIFAPNGPQVTWLKQDLANAQANPNIHWIILYWHHPPYTRGNYNSDDNPELVNIRTNFLPILEQYKVDMVITGHSHVYERSRLMKGLHPPNDNFSLSVHNPFVAGNAQSSGRYNGSANSCFYYKSTASTVNEGTIYVVNGAGGRSGGTPFNFGGVHPAMQSSIGEGGSMYIEVDGKRLDAKFVAASGTVKDQFTIIKDQEGFAIPPTNSTTYSAVCECTDTTSGFTHYADGAGNLLLSIKKYNYNIGRVGVAPFDLKLRGAAGVTKIYSLSTNYVKLASYGYRNVVAPWIAFNRHWTLTPGTELTGNSQVIVRQYHQEADLTKLNEPYADDPMGQGNLKPYKINDAATPYVLDPASGHVNIPQAGAYNRPGAWVYDARVDGTRGAYPTTHRWMWGQTSKGDYYGDYVVGRLKGGGGFGAPSNFQSNPSGHKDRAAQMWHYLVTTDPPADWKTTRFIGNWPRAYLPLGYSPGGQDGELTQIPNGCPPPNDFNTGCLTKNITTYFRAYLNHTGNNVNSYILNYRRNDGVIIYIDGQEVLPRDPNMPSGIITPTTPASAVTNELEWRTVIVPTSMVASYLLFPQLAVEVHQSSGSSNDLHLHVELVGTPDFANMPIGLRSAVVPAGELGTLPILYPNPATGGKVFVSPSLPYETLQLTDVQGRTYRYVAQPGMLRELDVSGLAVGTYILTSQYEGKVQRFKIVKMGAE